MALPRIGLWTNAFVLGAAAASREAAAEVEELGYGALWYPESVGGKEALSQAALLLAWTRRAVVCTGIASIYARDPMAAANGSRAPPGADPGGVSGALRARPRRQPCPCRRRTRRELRQAADGDARVSRRDGGGAVPRA